jgi:plastocyanin
MRRRLIPLTATAATSLLVAACGSGGAMTSAHTTPGAHGSAPMTKRKPLSGNATVAIRNFMFRPMTLTVTPGTKVTFHNYDQTAHTATAIGGGFNTGTVKPGKSVTVTIRKPGTYRYHCLFHAFMVARITVVRTSG